MFPKSNQSSRKESPKHKSALFSPLLVSSIASQDQENYIWYLFFSIKMLLFWVMSPQSKKLFLILIQFLKYCSNCIFTSMRIHTLYYHTITTFLLHLLLRRLSNVSLRFSSNKRHDTRKKKIETLIEFVKDVFEIDIRRQKKHLCLYVTVLHQGSNTWQPLQAAASPQTAAPATAAGSSSPAEKMYF